MRGFGTFFCRIVEALILDFFRYDIHMTITLYIIVAMFLGYNQFISIQGSVKHSTADTVNTTLGGTLSKHKVKSFAFMVSSAVDALIKILRQR